MTNYKLGDLVDIGILQRFADSNYQASGLPMTIVDAIDLAVLVKAGWPEICERYHRANLLSENRCRLSDNYVSEHLEEGEILQYKCRNGLWHVAIPIVVADKHLATLFLTQFFFEGELPDMDFFTRQAKGFGYDLDRYLEAVKALPIFSKEKVDYILAYDKAVARFIAEQAEQAIQTIETGKSLQESEEKYRTLINNVNIGIWRISGEGRFLEANPATARIFGYDSAESLLGMPLSSLLQFSSEKESSAGYPEQLMIMDREIQMRKKDGTTIWCAATITAHHGTGGKVIWLDGVMEDITERKEAREKLQKAYDGLEIRVRERTADLEKANELLLTEISERKHIGKKLKELSEIDPLTSIFNRRKLFELLEFEVNKAKRYRRPLSLLMFDIDSFKQVNDTFGHTVGDEVLSAIANIISNSIRNTDIFARYGGEEFVIVLTETDLNWSVDLAENIRNTINRHRFSRVGTITISIGVAQFSYNEDMTELIHRVDTALYSAKQSGRNRVVAASSPTS